MSPVPYTWAHFWPKFFSKSTKLKLDPLPPPRIISIHYLYWLLTRVYRKVGKNIASGRALKILHEKSRIFEMRRILFLQKKPPKKKKFSPATSGRRALRARLPGSHRAERRVNLRDNKKRKSNPFSCTVRSTNRTKPIRLPEAGADATAGNF